MLSQGLPQLKSRKQVEVHFLNIIFEQFSKSLRASCADCNTVASYMFTTCSHQVAPLLIKKAFVRNAQKIR